jgi:L-arabinose transport system substrate-binding protein
MRASLMVGLSLLVGCLGLAVGGCDRGGASSSTTSSSGRAAAGGTGQKVKVGYLVKQPEEPWFQTEWAFAQKAADENGFELLKIGTPDGEKVLTAIDNLAANGAGGFVICTPDVRLGPAIMAKAGANNLKVITVDDQFLGADGRPMADVHHLGVAARDVGHVSGQALADQFKARKWPVGQTAACVVTFDELDTARERTEGIIEKLVENGFPRERIFKTSRG